MAAPVDEELFVSLQLLLKAPSKEALRDLCAQSYQQGAPQSSQLALSTAGALGISLPEAQQLLKSLHSLARHVVFHSLSRPEQISRLFPASFHGSLKNLLTKILLELSRMAVPTCLLHLQLGEEQQVVVESSLETLDTMLDGLGRLRQQLALVAGK
ncbi:hypothetical protein CRUP_024429 [Coryphaenoides rupestris]|nr:hypothetical protein CRUP_024429 [Coryphaenoides rupestris]